MPTQVGLFYCSWERNVDLVIRRFPCHFVIKRIAVPLDIENGVAFRGTVTHGSYRNAVIVLKARIPIAGSGTNIVFMVWLLLSPSIFTGIEVLALQVGMSGHR